MRRVHCLKTWPEPFEAVLRGRKTYEIRVDDRGFAVNDLLLLQEYEPNGRGAGSLTGRELSVEVTHKTDGGRWGLPPNLCVLAIQRPSVESA